MQGFVRFNHSKNKDILKDTILQLCRKASFSSRSGIGKLRSGSALHCQGAFLGLRGPMWWPLCCRNCIIRANNLLVTARYHGSLCFDLLTEPQHRGHLIKTPYFKKATLKPGKGSLSQNPAGAQENTVLLSPSWGCFPWTLRFSLPLSGSRRTKGRMSTVGKVLE